MKWLYNLIMFFIVFIYRKLLCYYSDFLVYLHWRFTPRKSTEDLFTEMVLEKIRERQRLVEQRCYILWNKCMVYATNMGVKLIGENDE